MGRGSYKRVRSKTETERNLEDSTVTYRQEYGGGNKDKEN